MRIRLRKPMRRTGVVLVIVVSTGMLLVVEGMVVVPEAWTTPLSVVSTFVTFVDGIGVGDVVVVAGVTMVGMLVVAVIGVAVRTRIRPNRPRRATGALLVVVVMTTGVPLCVVTGVSSALAVVKVPTARTDANRNAFMMLPPETVHDPGLTPGRRSYQVTILRRITIIG